MSDEKPLDPIKVATGAFKLSVSLGTSHLDAACKIRRERRIAEGDLSKVLEQSGVFSGPDAREEIGNLVSSLIKIREMSDWLDHYLEKMEGAARAVRSVREKFSPTQEELHQAVLDAHCLGDEALREVLLTMV